MNNVWEKFGCNLHDLVFLAVAPWDDGTSMFNAYSIDPKFPIIDEDNGAPAIKTIFQGSENYAGPTFLVKPDKTSTKIEYTESSLTNSVEGAGVQENDCDPTSTEDLGNTSKIAKLSINSFAAGKLSVTVLQSGMYEIKVYTSSGKVISKMNTRLSAGHNIISMNSKNFAANMLIISVKNERNQIVEKRFLMSK